MPTNTTTYSFQKPVVGADEDSWGGYLNSNWDKVDDLFDGTSAITGIDINGGTIDGTVIGGSSAAAITGTTITGTSFVSSGNMTFGDNDKAIFGAGSDLQIYHDGSNSYIKDSGTGNLRINAGELTLTNADDNQNRIVTTSDGTVYLYNGGSIKLATTSTGIDVTGTVAADAVVTDTLVLSDGGDRTITGPLNNDLIINSRGNTFGEGTRIQSSGVDRLLVDDITGDISFYEDTGTTPKFFWDASAEALAVALFADSVARTPSGSPLPKKARRFEARLASE